jgi:hypothetical protein
MRLTSEGLMSYEGLHGFDGICHVRCYEQAGRLPVVIAGALHDNPGTALVNAIESAARSIEGLLFRDGREFRLIEYHPSCCDAAAEARFLEVHLQRVIYRDSSAPDAAVVGCRSAAKVILIGRRAGMDGDLRAERWERIENIEALVECKVQTWPRQQYTALAVAGARGEELRRQAARRVRKAADRLIGRLEAD